MEEDEPVGPFNDEEVIDNPVEPGKKVYGGYSKKFNPAFAGMTPNQIGDAIRLRRAKQDVEKYEGVQPNVPRTTSKHPVTDLKYYMDGFLRTNLNEVPNFLKKSWDCVIIVSGSGKVRIGKLLPLGSNILMSNGSWKKIDNVKINDKVVSPTQDGKKTSIANVIDKVNHKDREMCEIRNSNDNTLLYKCCTEHNVPVRTLWIKGSHKNPEYVWKDEIYLAGDLAEKNESWFRNHCPKIITSPIITKFDKEDFEINPYLMGLYLGDGNIASKNRLVITNPEKNIFDWLTKNTKIKYVRDKNRCPMIYLDYNTIQIEKVCGNGAYNKKIPRDALTSSYEYRKKLFEGLLDTDAYINPSGFVTYTTASEQLAKDVEELAKTLGCGTSINIIYKNCQSFKEKRKYFNVYINLGEFSKELNLLRESRRKRLLEIDISNTKNKECQYTTIRVTKTGERLEGYCIEVDSESHLYITDNYSVTHNSTMAIQMGYYLAWLMNENKKSDKSDKVPFDINNIVFSPDELMQTALKLPKHSVIVYDEGRAGLDSARAMENINKATQDFFQECGQLGHIIVIVLPDFFKLSEMIAVPRSLFLINCYTDRNYNRGYFSFFSEKKKEVLYVFGKGKKITVSKYLAIEPNFHGKFVDYFPLDKDLYDNKKKEALKKRKKSQRDVRWHMERDTMFYILKVNYKMTYDAIAKQISKMLDHEVGIEAIQFGVEQTKKRLEREYFEKTPN